MDSFFRKLAERSAAVLGSWQAFIIACALCLIWGVTGPLFNYSDTWQLVINTSTTILTFLAVFLIQNEQNRDSAANQLKMDELIRALEGARNEFIGVETEPEEHIERMHDEVERRIDDNEPN